MWTKKQIKVHQETAKKLIQIRNGALNYIKTNTKITEVDVRKLIQKEFKKNNLVSSKESPIVAFDGSCANPHYFPKRPKHLCNNCLIMLDIWARDKKNGSPYADMTWMAYKGKRVPKKIQEMFDLVIKSRDCSLSYIKSQLKKGNFPNGCDLDHASRQCIRDAGYASYFIHSTGHSLGNYSPHGCRGGLRKSNHKPIHKNYGYTIEPGVYFPRKFGIRSEINFYINDDNKVIITSDLQKKIIII
ncbi:MAG: M24 family metallopeptidase [archaeon]|nr:M24 family metallopeptidase [Nanoarchaeota archaeon]